MTLRFILRDIKRYIKIKKFNTKWRNNNQHNKTNANSIFPIEKVSVGKLTYGKLNIHYYNTAQESLTIGNFVSIADEVQFFLGGEHDYNNIMTFPFKNILTKNKIQEAMSKGPIIVEDDVWIGYGAIILSGVKIGKGSVIGAGSVVAKNVEPYSIYVGNKVIKKRFNQDIINKLEQVDYSKINVELLDTKIDNLYQHVTEENVDDLINILTK